MSTPADKGIEGKGDGEARERLRQTGGDVAGCKGTERGEHKGEEAGSHPKQTPGEVGKQKAREEIDGTLHIQDGDIVLRTEDTEAEQEKDRVAGKADQRGDGKIRRAREAVDTVLEPAKGDVPVDIRISGDDGGVVDEPEAQESAERECDDGARPQPGLLLSHSSA